MEQSFRGRGSINLPDNPKCHDHWVTTGRNQAEALSSQASAIRSHEFHLKRTVVEKVRRERRWTPPDATPARKLDRSIR
jgi:hypothetical protein